jgi:probable HAF family extracellular repeat protein
MYSAGQIYNLGSFGGSRPSCSATGVNSGGEPVGFCLNPAGFVRAFYVSKFLRDFDPSHVTYISVARGINDSGVAVGYSNRAPCSPPSLTVCQGSALRPTIFSPNGTIQVLGLLGSADTEANAINNLGDIVGLGTAATGGWHGFIYTHGTLFDLNSASFRNTANTTLRGWVIQSADGINDAGQIVGTGFDPSGTLQIVILTPVPVQVASVTLYPTSVPGGNPSTGIVTLNRPVPVGGSVTISLSSNNGAVQVPSSVTVTYPNSGASFSITTTYVPITINATITASYGSSAKNAVLTVYDPGS